MTPRRALAGLFALGGLALIAYFGFAWAEVWWAHSADDPRDTWWVMIHGHQLRADGWQFATYCGLPVLAGVVLVAGAWWIAKD